MAPASWDDLPEPQPSAIQLQNIKVLFSLDASLWVWPDRSKRGGPPGGGSGEQRVIVIEPSQLTGLTGEALEAAVADLTGNLAIVTRAVSQAVQEFNDAIADWDDEGP